ncbi:MAG: hypothetical protein M3Q23_16580, partial [Actinomycetota bacterium]|nr:hypothetical protein [Actinomycetota bacterium]
MTAELTLRAVRASIAVSVTAVIFGTGLDVADGEPPGPGPVEEVDSGLGAEEPFRRSRATTTAANTAAAPRPEATAARVRRGRGGGVGGALR